MNKSVNTIRTLAIEAIENANSGHPGICMGAAPMIYSLYNHQMKINPKNSDWINRDRFVLSAGHGSAMLYSILHLSGYNISIDDLKNFRQLDSITPGHPESFLTDGVDVSTGPLGQGIAMAVGMAMSERFLASKLNEPNYNIIDHFTYVLCGDGDLMEGVSYEACSIAGKMKLNKLILLHDSNKISLDGDLSISFNENLKIRFESMNWNYICVLDGEDVDAIDAAIYSAKSSDKPTIIEVKTIIGYGANKKVGTNKVHGAPLGKEELEYAKNSYGLNQDAFSVEKEVYEDFNKNVVKKGKNANEIWDSKLEEYKTKYPQKYLLYQQIIASKFKDIIMESYSKDVASRVASHEAINQIAKQDELFIGGSADLSSSNNTTINTDSKFIIDDDQQRNIYFGVRELAMGAIINGMAVHSKINVFASTFMVFSDYLKPAIRLSALMKLGNTFVFTHDSVAVGEDGPTHQPIEQIAMFRAMPNLNLIRPADANETIAAWHIAYMSNETPTVLSLTRQKLPILTSGNMKDIINDVEHGAYQIYGDDKFDTVLIASGSEVNLAIQVAIILQKKGMKISVVSMPSQELFNQMTKEYQLSIIPENCIVYAIELLSTFGWERYTKKTENIFGLNDFGMSGSAKMILDKLDYTPEKIAQKILKG